VAVQNAPNMTCNLKAESFCNTYLCNVDGTCRTPNCPYVSPGLHPSSAQQPQQPGNNLELAAPVDVQLEFDIEYKFDF
jgi:hypothetical protein